MYVDVSELISNTIDLTYYRQHVVLFLKKFEKFSLRRDLKPQYRYMWYVNIDMNNISHRFRTVFPHYELLFSLTVIVKKAGKQHHDGIPKTVPKLSANSVPHVTSYS